jgi:ATP-dependent DNA helicase PIF1
MDNNKELQYILDCIENNQSVFITGPAGTGKTYLIKALQKILREKNINAVLTSTTGINALSIEGVTIHKFMGIGIQTSSSYLYVLKKSPFYKNICHRIMATDVIIIDEISMLRGDTFELINLVLQDVCNTKQPFGGKTMIFTGDFFQIPPVVKS